jgi:hypothetical protein
VLAYLRTVDWWGDSGTVQLVMPFATLAGTASFLGQPVSRDVGGLLDPSVRASINFYGAPALTLKEFAGYVQDLVIGGSLDVTMPLGQYDDARAVNLGTNRWSFKPEVGMSKTFGRWSVEGAVAVTLYGRNDSFFGGHSLQKAPLGALQTNVTRTFDGGIWAALGATHYLGGHTTLDGRARDDALRNTRVGATLSIPIDRANTIKLNASSGIGVRTGTDFDTVGFVWVYRWATPS